MADRIHLCPSCRGQGTVSKPPWVAGDRDVWVSTSTGLHPCPVCRGKGIVEEQSRG